MKIKVISMHFKCGLYLANPFQSVGEKLLNIFLKNSIGNKIRLLVSRVSYSPNIFLLVLLLNNIFLLVLFLCFLYIVKCV